MSYGYRRACLSTGCTLAMLHFITQMEHLSEAVWLMVIGIVSHATVFIPIFVTFSVLGYLFSREVIAHSFFVGSLNLHFIMLLYTYLHHRQHWVKYFILFRLFHQLKFSLLFLFLVVIWTARRLTVFLRRYFLRFSAYYIVSRSFTIIVYKCSLLSLFLHPHSHCLLTRIAFMEVGGYQEYLYGIEPHQKAF